MKPMRRLVQRPVFHLVLWVSTILWSLPAQASSTLNFPRLSFDESTYTGVTIVNPSDQEALITLTAYGENGQLLTGIDNPVQETVPARSQLVKLAREYFGGGLDPATVAWFQVTSPVDTLTGFFLLINGTQTEFDGADLPITSQRIVFNEVRLDSISNTELNIINPGDAVADLELRLVSPDSSFISKSLPLQAHGVVRLDAATLFGVVQATDGSYIDVISQVPPFSGSAREVAGFALVTTQGGDSLGMNAQPGGNQLSSLYFPQMAVLGPWKTELSLVNYSARPVIVTISAFKADGTLFDTNDLQNNPITRTLAGNSSLGEGEEDARDVEKMFGFMGSDTLEGWLLVDSTSQSINGSISYGLPSLGSVASVISSAEGQKRALFSHIATSSGYFTGVAMLNSGQLATNVRVLAITSVGTVLGAYNTVLRPGQRLSRLINQFIPEAANQAAGFIWVKSDSPIHLTSIFGSSVILANIPPQIAPDGYAPDSGLPSVKVSPPLAILQLNQSQPFSLTGQEGSVTWYVDGLDGGNTTSGTIDSTGIFGAPKAVPKPQVVTVTGQVEGQTAGASVDIMTKENLLVGLATVQSVAYLGSLQKLFTAELALLSALEEGPQPATAQRPAQESATTEIYEKSVGLQQVRLDTFQNETISKMIPFTASNGKEFLLLAAKTSGKVIRLDPSTKERRDVATGLNQPETLVLDPVTGNLLVAEQDQISVVSKSVLEAGIASSLDIFPSAEHEEVTELLATSSTAGIAVDECTGNIFYSDQESGKILQFNRDTQEVSTVFAGLNQPTRIVGIHRRRVPCPDSFQLLMIEDGSDVINVTSPSRRFLRRWIPAQDATDLVSTTNNAFLSGQDSVLLTETVVEDQVERKTVSAIVTEDVFSEKIDNPVSEQTAKEQPAPEPEAKSYVLTINHTGAGGGKVEISPLDEVCGPFPSSPEQSQPPPPPKVSRRPLEVVAPLQDRSRSLVAVL